MDDRDDVLVMFNLVFCLEDANRDRGTVWLSGNEDMEKGQGGEGGPSPDLDRRAAPGPGAWGRTHEQELAHEGTLSLIPT